MPKMSDSIASQESISYSIKEKSMQAISTHWVEIACIKASDEENANFVVSFVLSLVGGIFSFDKARDKKVLIFVLIFVLNFDFFISYEIDS
jgi:hypothetical protein